MPTKKFKYEATIDQQYFAKLDVIKMIYIIGIALTNSLVQILNDLNTIINWSLWYCLFDLARTAVCALPYLAGPLCHGDKVQWKQSVGYILLPSNVEVYLET